ncbi:hypothetical protein NXC14_PA00319 (plasmid) [Rhizobium sp. NXC14]|nr:hypothetical protein NXC14_PA00319 [Rhizobium sp. NXC14]
MFWNPVARHCISPAVKAPSAKCLVGEEGMNKSFSATLPTSDRATSGRSVMHTIRSPFAGKSSLVIG